MSDVDAKIAELREVIREASAAIKDSALGCAIDDLYEVAP